jgi:hypothetical protein
MWLLMGKALFTEYQKRGVYYRFKNNKVWYGLARLERPESGTVLPRKKSSPSRLVEKVRHNIFALVGF